MKIDITKEQARILWSLINNQQNVVMKVVGEQTYLATKTDSEHYKSILEEWHTETACEWVALSTFKKDLENLLEGKNKE